MGGNPINFVDPYGLWAFGDPLPQSVVDFSAGFGDALSFGATDWVRDRMGTNGVVNKCSGGYSAGEWAGTAHGFAAGGLGIAKSLGRSGARGLTSSVTNGGSVGAMKLVSFGKNAQIKLRKHSQHMRETVRKLGIEIPKGPGKQETRAAMEDFITHVAAEGKLGHGPYMTFKEAQWSRLGDAVVVRKMNGEFITFLDATKGGVMNMAPKGF